MEGTLLGVPSLAISLLGRGEFRFDAAARFSRRLATWVVEPGSARHASHVKFPRPRMRTGRRGVRARAHTHGATALRDAIVEKVDRAQKYYWIGGEELEYEDEEGTDFHPSVGAHLGDAHSPRPHQLQVVRRLRTLDFPWPRLRRERGADGRRAARARGIHDSAVLAAIRNVPVTASSSRPSAGGRTTTRRSPSASVRRSPSLHGPLMTEAIGIHGGSHVLEVGNRSGYHAAVSPAGCPVLTLERLPDLAAHARHASRRARPTSTGYRGGADGTLGRSAGAPYDAILVTAAAPQIPRPLIAQLAPHGCLVLRWRRKICRLVRLRRGAEGWSRNTSGSAAS